MADLEYTVGVNTKRAQKNLKKLQTTTAGTSEAFGKLRNAVAGLAIGNFIRTSFQAAAALDSLSQATGLAAETIVGFSTAFVNANGTIDRSRDALSDFTKNVGMAITESTELRRSFRALGIDMEEFVKLTPDERLKATVQALADLDDQSERVAIQLRIFGESFKGIPIDQVEQDLAKSIRTSGEAATAYRAAGEASRNLSNAITILRQELVIALAPLSDFVNKLSDTEEGTRKVIRGIVQFGTSLAGLLIVGKVASGLFGLVGGVFALGRNLNKTRRVASRFVGTYKTFATTAKLAAASTALFRARLIALRFVGAALLPLFGKIAAALFLISEAIRAVTGAGLISWAARAGRALEETFVDAVNNLARFLGILKETPDEKTVRLNVLGPEDGPGTSPGRPGGESGERSLERQAQQNTRLVDLLKEQKLQIDEVARSYAQRTENTIETLRQEQELLGLKEDERAVQQTINDFTRQYEQQVQSLRARLRQLNLEPEKNAALIERVNAALVEVTREYNAQLPVVEQLARENENIRQSQEAAAEAQRRVTSAVSQTNDFLVGLGDSTEDMRRELLELDMSPLERQISRIETQINRDAVNAIQNLYEELQEVDDPAARQRIENQIERIESAAAQAIESQSRLAEQSFEHQRSFARGWEEAFKEYQDNATNAAKQAQRVFETTTRGIEDTIVDFAKTGKFEFKGLVTDILETIFRSNIQQVIAKVFNPDNFSGGGILGGIGDLLGIGGAGNPLAQKGQNANNPLFVQEVSGVGGGIGGIGAARTGGGGLGGIISGVKNAVSGIFGGGNQPRQIGMGSSSGFLPGAPGIGTVSSGIGGIFDTVKNVAKGVGSLFGGFFATGGQIPPGRFGVVGESGPEIVSGPANVTPMSGGMSVTLNINAVDAQSFKSLVARDPEFIAAVAQKGAQAVPARR